jgi:hypothetical protein
MGRWAWEQMEPWPVTASPFRRLAVRHRWRDRGDVVAHGGRTSSATRTLSRWPEGVPRKRNPTPARPPEPRHHIDLLQGIDDSESINTRLRTASADAARERGTSLIVVVHLNSERTVEPCAKTLLCREAAVPPCAPVPRPFRRSPRVGAARLHRPGCDSAATDGGLVAAVRSMSQAAPGWRVSVPRAYA